MREEDQNPNLRLSNPYFAMDEAQEILLNSLQSTGISLPSNLSSIKDLTPDSLVSICAQLLTLIDGSSSSFPTSLPSSMADKFKICEDLASAVKGLGYREPLSFHQVPIFSFYIVMIKVCNFFLDLWKLRCHWCQKFINMHSIFHYFA